MLRKQQEGHLRSERDLLAAAATSTRWTVQLAYSFQDVDHLYLVMDFMGGGGESFSLAHPIPVRQWLMNEEATFRSSHATHRERHV